MIAKPPVYKPEWAKTIKDFINANRLQIFADIIDIISSHKPFDIQPATRMPLFEVTVLQPACGTPEQYPKVIAFLTDKKEETNSDEELARRLEEELIAHIMSTKHIIGTEPLDPASDCIFIRTQVLEQWFENFKGIKSNRITETIRNLARTGMIPQVSVDPIRWPHNDNKDGIRKRSGVFWNPQKITIEQKANIRVLSLISYNSRNFF